MVLSAMGRFGYKFSELMAEDEELFRLMLEEYEEGMESHKEV